MVRLLPTDRRFFPWLIELGTHLRTAATLLRDVFVQSNHTTALVWRIKEIEAETDRRAQEITQQIVQTFVPPLDPEDIHTLTLRLAAAVDLVEDAAQRTEMYRIASSQESALRLAEILLRAAIIIDLAVRNLEDPGTILQHVAGIKPLEEEADVLHNQAVGALFREPTAVLDVIKWKDIYDALENAVDCCEDVADVLTSIALKNT